MHCCLICDKKYKTISSYNDHLNRSQHKTNVIKLESIYSRNPHSASYKQWKINREIFDNVKKEEKKNNNTE